MASDSNVLCSFCHFLPAEVVCLCAFPLPALCRTDCLAKHRVQGPFHFELPLALASSVTAETFKRQKRWLMGLSDAHQDIAKVSNSVLLLEEQLQNAFRIIEEEVECMKNSYREEINRVKREVNEMVSRAIEETKAQAFSLNPELRSPLGKWVWKNANSSDFGGIQLYEPVVNIENVKKKVNALLEVRLKRSDLALPEIRLGERQKTAICKTCKGKITTFDEEFQCPGACQCSHCLIQASISRPHTSNCTYCLQPLPEAQRTQILAAYMACHVCGVAVRPGDEVEKGLPCLPCQRCVAVTQAPVWKPWAKLTGHCPDCNTKSIELDEEIYPLARSGDRACCSKATGELELLQCGHWVCAVHAEYLKRCRVCWRLVQRTSFLCS